MLIVQNQLIRTCRMRRGFVQFFIRPVFIVIERYLPAAFYRFVDSSEIIKKRSIFGFIPVFNGINVLYVGLEIFVRQHRKFFYKVFRVVFRDVLARQNPVDQKAKFGIFEK